MGRVTGDPSDGLPPLKGRSEGEDLYGPREVLNEVRHRDDLDLRDVVVWYVHRGASGDLAAVPGDEIREVGTSFFEVPGPAAASTRIPFHRVRRVTYRGELVWERATDQP